MSDGEFEFGVCLGVRAREASARDRILALHFLIGAVVLWLEGGRARGSGMETMGGEVRGVGWLESEWWRRG